VASSAQQYFSTLFHKRHDFRKKVIEHKMCVVFVSTIFFLNISHSEKTERDMIKKCILIFM